MHKKMEELTKLKNDMIDKLKEGCCNDTMDVQTAGEFTDMIKDIAEAEEKCWKACYYKEIVCAMDDARQDEGGQRMGYDHYRYASGRFAPSGHGHYSAGYSPMTGPYMSEVHDLAGRMGYPTPHMSQTGSTMRYGATDTERSDYGRSYDGYRRARRGYSETHSAEDKHKMHEHAKSHLSEAEMSIREIWKDADPELKRKMKEDMQKLVNDMTM